MEELEKGEKGWSGDGTLSYGLASPGDTTLTYWTATVVGPMSTVHESRLYTLSIECGPKYPEVPPKCRFRSAVNASFVNLQTGEVVMSALKCTSHWNRSYSMETLLQEIRKYSYTLFNIYFRELASPANRRLEQPPEGIMFPDQ